MKDHKWQESQATFYQAVAREADLEVLADRCPKGFKPFRERLQTLAKHLSTERAG